MAVNVTAVPLHTEVAPELIDTEAGADELTVIAIVFDVAVEGVAQAALLVSTTLTASLLFKVDVAKEALLVPAFTPFTFH